MIDDALVLSEPDIQAEHLRFPEAQPHPERIELPTLIDINELACRLGTTPRHVRRLVSDRRVPSLRVGGFVRFDPSEIRRWLDNARVPSVESATPVN
jgi:excisionase family DNA binding protein